MDGACSAGRRRRAIARAPRRVRRRAAAWCAISSGCARPRARSDRSTPPDHVWLEVAGQVRLDGDRRAPADAQRGTSADGRAAVARSRGRARADRDARRVLLLAARRRPPGRSARAGTRDRRPSHRGRPELATQHYESAIAELDALAKTNDGTLDPAIAATLQQNIAAIDQRHRREPGAVRRESRTASRRARACSKRCGEKSACCRRR